MDLRLAMIIAITFSSLTVKHEAFTRIYSLRQTNVVWCDVATIIFNSQFLLWKYSNLIKYNTKRLKDWELFPISQMTGSHLWLIKKGYAPIGRHAIF